ncbi:MAG: hypothetical protein ABI745_09555 [Caldimonas sp.]
MLRSVLLGIAAVILFFEEWGWRPLTACAAWIARWPPLAALEAAICRTTPHVAFALFFVPAALLVPVKLGALWLLGNGQATLGIGLIVAAKVFSTAFVGRLFVLVEPQLMTYAWFARAIGWWRATRDRVMAVVRRSPLWRSGRAMRRLARRGFDRLAAWFHKSRR